MAQKLLTNPIINALAKTPYGSTDGTDRDSKKVIARFFGGAAFVCYVLEDDSFFKEYKEGDGRRVQPPRVGLSEPVRASPARLLVIYNQGDLNEP